MSNCPQTFYGPAKDVNINNINVTYQVNTQEAPRRNTQQPNQSKCGCIFRKQIKSIIKLSKSKVVNQRSQRQLCF